jgi:hypothetical protein
VWECRSSLTTKAPLLPARANTDVDNTMNTDIDNTNTANNHENNTLPVGPGASPPRPNKPDNGAGPPRPTHSPQTPGPNYHENSDGATGADGADGAIGGARGPSDGGEEHRAETATRTAPADCGLAGSLLLFSIVCE